MTGGELTCSTHNYKDLGWNAGLGILPDGDSGNNGTLCKSTGYTDAAAPGIRSLLSTRAKLCSNYSHIRYIFVKDEIRLDVAVNSRRHVKIQVYCTVRL